jgi:hypothetical protein
LQTALHIQVDDILAALMLSLVMVRRLETRTASAEHNPGVPRARFDEWRKQALRGYNQVAIACAAKVVLNVGWYWLGLELEVQAPWFQLVGVVIFLGWTTVMVWAWKIATDARYLRMQLGIALKRPRSAPQA